MTTATTSPPTERPILFSAPMVRALLAGHKTQTRRIVKPQPAKTRDGWEWRQNSKTLWHWPGGLHMCPFGQPGDRLWVRESHAIRSDVDPVAEQEKAQHYTRYRDNREDGDDLSGEWHNYGRGWRPSIHMPRWASRITLEVESVRVERVQDISESDALAEGQVEFISGTGAKHYGLNAADCWEPTAAGAFARLWDVINGKTCPWASNPWVWVVTFRKPEGRP